MFKKLKNRYYKPGSFFGLHVVNGFGQGSAEFVDAPFPGSHFPWLLGGGVLAKIDKLRIEL